MDRHPIRSPEERDVRTRAKNLARLKDPEFDQSDPGICHAQKFIEGVEAASTTNSYTSGLIRWFRYCRERGMRPLEVKRTDAKVYLASLAEFAPRYRANLMTIARAFYASVMDEHDDLFARNPFDRVWPKNPRAKTWAPALTEEQFDEVLLALRERIAAKPDFVLARRDFALVYLAGRIGPRRITLGRLRLGDVLQERGVTLLVFRLKGGRHERVSLPEDVAGTLWAWLGTLQQAIGRELTEADGIFPPVGPHATRLHRYAERPVEPMTLEAITERVKARLADAGIVGHRWAPHAMRASAITIADENGVELKLIQRMACHIHQSQTEEYIRRRDTRSAAAGWIPSTPWQLDEPVGALPLPNLRIVNDQAKAA